MDSICAHLQYHVDKKYDLSRWKANGTSETFSEKAGLGVNKPVTQETLASLAKMQRYKDKCKLNF